MKQIKDQQFSKKTIIIWLIYIVGVLNYVLFNLQKIPQPIFEENSQISLFSSILIVIAIYLSLSKLLNYKRAFAYLFYWLIIFLLGEKLFLALGLFSHDEGATTFWGDLPLVIGINWLILIFPIYSLATFAISRFYTKKKSKKLVFTLLLDGCSIVLFTLLLDPIGQNAGYWSWDNSNAFLLVWGLIPIQIYCFYFIGYIFISLPLRWLETYSFDRNDELYYQGFSFPLYLIWSVFIVLSYWAFRKSIDEVGWFGLMISALILVFYFFKRKKIPLQ